MPLPFLRYKPHGRKIYGMWGGAKQTRLEQDTELVETTRQSLFIPIESHPKDSRYLIRGGREGGGKGALIQENKSATLGTSNDQYMFVPASWGGKNILSR